MTSAGAALHGADSDRECQSRAVAAGGNARATADSALASSILNVSATVGTNWPAFRPKRRARADGDSALSTSLTALSVAGWRCPGRSRDGTVRSNVGRCALASSISGVNADFNGRFAQGLIKFEPLQLHPCHARFAVLLRANYGGSIYPVGFLPGHLRLPAAEALRAAWPLMSTSS